MAGGCPYLVCLLALVSPDDCFLSGDPCHFDATPVGSAFSGWVYTHYHNSAKTTHTHTHLILYNLNDFKHYHTT